MSARLSQIQITDFRSICGTITVPLDAPVVLVHGPNGSGKTSLLSAIELGLTGSVASLKRFDQSYAQNLVHLDAKPKRAVVTISADHKNINSKSAELVVRGAQMNGVPLLSASQSRFFTERSFLAQATLSRLLEIYEASDARKTESPLTRFVNDLLGIDQLDALVEGSHAVRDKRRLVKSLPLYGEADEELKGRDKDVARLTDAVATAQLELAERAEKLTEALARFGLQSSNELDKGHEQLGDGESERQDAVVKAALKRDIEAALTVWRRIEMEPGRKELADAERTLQQLHRALENWIKEKGPGLDAALDAATALYTDLSPARSVGWSAAHAEAVREMIEDQARTEIRLSRDETARKALTDLNETLNKAVAREGRLDESLGALAGSSGEMVEALSELAPLVESEICPVCQRDYSEIGITSLRTHLATHLSTLSQTASRLRSLADERQAVRKQIADHRKELSRLEEVVLDDGELAELRNRQANLSDALRRLKETADTAEEGDALLLAVKQASEKLATLRRDKEALIGVRQSALQFTEELALDPPAEREGLSAVLDRCLEAVDQALQAASRREQYRKQAEEAVKSHADVRTRLKTIETELRQAEAGQKRVKSAIRAADRVRAEVRKLSDRAIDARTAVVREVFNESLNKVWNNLFIRLAPEEPFVPAFELPKKGKGPVEAKLITRYRGEDYGGNPKAMLSSGNLNTAALTLFLSLHLSVKPLLPWLVLDDPVQSMDEIHISQFAALLRTLSKQRGRQIIIAVHERPLFEYLALELSPASPGDKLITIELSKDSDGRTIPMPRPIVWDAETVFQAEAI